MSRAFALLPDHRLSTLADALEGHRLAPPYTQPALQRYLVADECTLVAEEFQRLGHAGFGPAQLAVLLRALKVERDETRKARDEVELVWTGPEVAGSASRDTSVVMRELFGRAEKSVLLATFALSHADTLLAPLVEQMDRNPDLRVRLFVHIGRRKGETASDAELLRRFAESFRNEHWPGERAPEVFYDPRTLQPRGDHGRISLHAKCVIVDEALAFVTSANFTEAAQLRNIEAGVIVKSPGFAKNLIGQFQRLVTARQLLRVPGLG